MYDKKAETQAERFGILDRLQALEDDLLKIEGVSDIDFDIDYYDEIPEVILIPRYNVPDDPDPGNWFRRRANQLRLIIETCAKHHLFNSGDRIEDYGEHWYIVREPDSTWPRVVKHEDP